MIARSRCCLSSQVGASLLNPHSTKNRESDNWASFARLTSRSCSLFVARIVNIFGYFFSLPFFVRFIRISFLIVWRVVSERGSAKTYPALRSPLSPSFPFVLALVFLRFVHCSAGVVSCEPMGTDRGLSSVTTGNSGASVKRRIWIVR